MFSLPHGAKQRSCVCSFAVINSIRNGGFAKPCPGPPANVSGVSRTRQTTPSEEARSAAIVSVISTRCIGRLFPSAYQGGFKMFKFIWRFVSPSRDPDDAIVTSRIANACTAQDLITAHIIKSMATDIGAWSCGASEKTAYAPSFDSLPDFVGRRYGSDNYRDRAATWTFKNESGLSFSTRVSVREDYVGDSRYRPCEVSYTDNTVTDGALTVTITQNKAYEIVRAYIKLLNAKKAADAVADRAKEDMKNNEVAWNLAERLLGMTRTPDGALVPNFKWPVKGKPPARLTHRGVVKSGKPWGTDIGRVVHRCADCGGTATIKQRSCDPWKVAPDKTQNMVWITYCVAGCGYAIDLC